jgi:hypothetical protein
MFSYEKIVFLFTFFPMKKMGETPGFLIGGDDTVRASMLSR